MIASTVLAAFAEAYLATFVLPPQVVLDRVAGFVVLAIAGDAAARRRAADRDGVDVPDAGDLL